MLAVIALIALLTGIVLGLGRRATETGRAARARAELAALAAALEDCQRSLGDYPQTEDPAQLLQVLIGRRNPHNAVVAARVLIESARFRTEDVRDPFADDSAVLIDPWDRPYRYVYKTRSPWTNAGYVLWSAGADGRDSGTLLPGGFPDPNPPENADNIYASR